MNSKCQEVGARPTRGGWHLLWLQIHRRDLKASSSTEIGNERGTNCVYERGNGSNCCFKCYTLPLKCVSKWLWLISWCISTWVTQSPKLLPFLCQAELKQIVSFITSRKLDFPSLRHQKRRLESQRNQQNPEFWIAQFFCVVLTLLCDMYTSLCCTDYRAMSCNHPSISLYRFTAGMFSIWIWRHSQHRLPGSLEHTIASNH